MHGCATSLAALLMSSSKAGFCAHHSDSKGHGQNFYRECTVAFIYLTYLDIYTVPPALTLEHTTHHMHADSCSYFLIPSFQAAIRVFYATRHGMVLTHTVALFVLT